MNLNRLFPLQIVLSLRSRADRRETLAGRLAAADLPKVRWFSGVEREVLKNDARGFCSLPKRSCALGKRLIIREAALGDSGNLLFLEDDAVFDPDFKAKVHSLRLPKDWGIFYFGCQHVEPPQWAAAGIVRVQRAFDMHAVGINRKFFLRIRKAMRGGGKGAVGKLNSDVLLSNLHSEIPTYAAFPNLAWQGFGHSDNLGTSFSCYDAQGNQRFDRPVLSYLYPYVPEPFDAVLLRAPRRVMDALRKRGWHTGYWRDEKTGRDNGIRRLLESRLGDEKLRRSLSCVLRILHKQAKDIGGIVTIWEDEISREILQGDGINITEIKARTANEAENHLKHMNEGLYKRLLSRKVVEKAACL